MPRLPEPAPPSPSASQIPPIPCGALGRATGVDRSVRDHTGLTGTFDLNIEFAPTLPPGAAPPPGFTPDPEGPTFTEALRDQLGLKLVPQTSLENVLAIDSVEKPTPN
jgi:uncharacterized protein (TIGR03435 family)